MNARRRAIIVFASVPLAGCSGLGGPRTLHVAGADLQVQLARHFPLHRNVIGLVALELSAPQLRLLPQSGRLATAFDFTASSRLNGGEVSGQVEFEYGLRYDAAAAAIRIEQPRILRFDTGPRSAARLPQPLLGLIEAALDGMALYRVPPERLEVLLAAGLQPGAITVTGQGVDIRLDPIP